MRKPKTSVRRFFLDEELARIAKGQKTISALPAAYMLKEAARALRHYRKAVDAAIKAAGVPKGASVEIEITVAGHAAKIAGDVQFLEGLFRLEDPRG
jgi:hypothetical protein